MGHILEDAVVGGPALRRDDTPDVATLIVEEPHPGILPEHPARGIPHVGAVAAGGDRRADELGRNRRRPLVPVIDLEIVDPVAVDVPGQHHGVLGPPRGQKLHEPSPRRLVAAPLVHADPLFGARQAVHTRHHDLLRQDVPAGRRPVEAVEQPSLLVTAKQGRLRGGHAGARRTTLVSARLVRSILSRVQHEE